jgi:Fis family transcriptional regulator, factor for inversion stimulation protein
MSVTLKTPPSLQDCIVSNLDYYIQSCQGQNITGVYEMVLSTIEKPMLQVVMTHCNNNQSAAADFLGLNRNTLRKKLLEHKLLGE